jgi:hypothetical protein
VAASLPRQAERAPGAGDGSLPNSSAVEEMDRFASIADRAQETCEREAIDAGSSFNGPCIAVAAIALETEGSAHNAAAPPRVVMSIEMQRLTLTC